MNRKNSQITDLVLKEVSTFPSMPQAGIKLSALLKKDNSSPTEIEEILRQDPGLSANVLRLANSAFFGLPRKVGSLKQAVMLLGVKRFAQIAVSASMSKTMEKSVEGYELSSGDLWRHSIVVANTAESLAANRTIPPTIDVFIPALLHDLGKLVLGMFVKGELQKIQDITSNAVPMDIAEHMVLGTDHAEIGALILAKWSLPNDIVTAVRWHHNPEGMKKSSIQADIVYLSNHMCQSDISRYSGRGQSGIPSSAVLKRLGIETDECQIMIEKAQSRMKELGTNDNIP